MLHRLKTLVPAPLRSLYHYAAALLGALLYRFPAHRLYVVGITGTKGKSSTAELVSAMLEEGGEKTALLGTIRFKIGDESRPNLRKMTMPGRFFIQRFLCTAVRRGCTYAIIEMTSEGAAQHRHRFVPLDALIFTNIAPEHIESHGSFEKYLGAKLLLRDALDRSRKKNKLLVVNADDAHAHDFLAAQTPAKAVFSLRDAEPYRLSPAETVFSFEGKEMTTPLPGRFALYNILAAATFARSRGVSLENIGRAVTGVRVIPGRMEAVDCGQNFSVIVDYAHTRESLEGLYQTFPGKKICVFGATGGGRDRWKRKEMGAIAGRYCDRIILTDEDPYDEDPRAIIADVKSGIAAHTPEIILDRRLAVREAFAKAEKGTTVLITGKGTDPYIMGPRGTKRPWSDKTIAEEELRALFQEKKR